MISLKELKNRIKNQYGLQDIDSCSSFGSSDIMSKLSQQMILNADKVAEIEEEIGQGEDFRCYFSDREMLKEFIKMHEDDVDSFYRILRKEELFLNTCLKTFGIGNMIISLNPDTLLRNLENLEDDSDDEDEDL